ncbi:MAG: aminopeptidase P family protein [Candidatus Lindowbacteria bacterium]|nr:aminopeptidase P family protein [Candidatus Lindowbacteria bacterium]
MGNRIDALRNKLREAGADAFVCYSYPNYRYLSGFTGSLAILIISLDRAIIMSDFRYRTQIAQEVTALDFVEIKGPSEETVFSQIKELKISKLAFESAHLTYRHYALLKAIESLELVPTENWVEDLRAIKDGSEIELIEKAAWIADAAMEKILKEIRPGMTEQAVANSINTFIRSLGGRKEAFDLIVASGPRSAMPHGAPSDREIQAGESVVIDIGAQFKGYHSDLTRTVWLDKIKSSQVLEIYNIVKDAQAAAIGAIRADMPCVDIDAVARNRIAEAGYGEQFGHGLGHGVGLEVHEQPTVSRLGKGSIKPGMVFTVEPGIYIPDVGGVRIEDMVVVTIQGCRKLTASANYFEIGL